MKLKAEIPEMVFINKHKYDLEMKKVDAFWDFIKSMMIDSTNTPTTMSIRINPQRLASEVKKLINDSNTFPGVSVNVSIIE